MKTMELEEFGVSNLSQIEIMGIEGGSGCGEWSCYCHWVIAAQAFAEGVTRGFDSFTLQH